MESVVKMFIKYKEVTKNFNFSKAFNRDELPGYIKHYVLEGENILVAYKTQRDHGVFTDSQIVLFDSEKNMGRKQIYTIPYDSISTISITFDKDSAELNILLENGYPIVLNFINTEPEDKLRLRLLYTVINRIICGKEPSERDVERLMRDDLSFN